MQGDAGNGNALHFLLTGWSCETVSLTGDAIMGKHADWAGEELKKPLHADRKRNTSLTVAKISLVISMASLLVAAYVAFQTQIDNDAERVELSGVLVDRFRFDGRSLYAETGIVVANNSLVPVSVVEIEIVEHNGMGSYIHASVIPYRCPDLPLNIEPRTAKSLNCEAPVALVAGGGAAFASASGGDAYFDYGTVSRTCAYLDGAENPPCVPTLDLTLTTARGKRFQFTIERFQGERVLYPVRDSE